MYRRPFWTCPIPKVLPDKAQFATQPRSAGFEAGWPASKPAGPIHDQWKVMARFETRKVDSFETRCNAVDGFKTGWVDVFETR